MPSPASPPSDANGRAGRLAVGLVVTAVLGSLALGEGLVRLLVRRDADGQEWMRDVRLRPYPLPLDAMGATLAAMQDARSFLAYDPDLGWVPRPHAQSVDGLRRVDRAGIRSDDDVAREPRSGVLRIAVFGDSFTFGDEVGVGDTWSAALEHGLAVRGTDAEVLNFGVNAYGMDQAYLRWRRQGKDYRPAVVVFGFQPENVLRNLNVFRPVYFVGSEVPLSKPRFVVRDGALVVVNVPTIPPDRITRTLAALADEPLLEHERYFAPFARRWWLRSKTAALVAAMIESRRDPFRLDAENRDIAERILDDFAADVRAAGAAFLVVHLPRREDLLRLRDRQELWYADLLRVLADRHTLVHPERSIAALDDALFAPQGHYGPALNRVVGEALVDPVLQAAARR